MHEIMSSIENLTDSSFMAKLRCDEFIDEIKKVGREDALQNAKILDVGGGIGKFSEEMNKRGIFCVSLDIKDLFTKEGANPVRADAYHMPFADASFSIVHGHGSFDADLYKHDFAKLLSEVARILKPKGILYVDYFTLFASYPSKELEKYFKKLKSKELKEEIWEKIN